MLSAGTAALGPLLLFSLPIFSEVGGVFVNPFAVDLVKGTVQKRVMLEMHAQAPFVFFHLMQLGFNAPAGVIVKNRIVGREFRGFSAGIRRIAHSMHSLTLYDLFFG